MALGINGAHDARQRLARGLEAQPAGVSVQRGSALDVY
jgi:hypothetical protein